MVKIYPTHVVCTVLYTQQYVRQVHNVSLLVMVKKKATVSSLKLWCLLEKRTPYPRTEKAWLFSSLYCWRGDSLWFVRSSGCWGEEILNRLLRCGEVKWNWLSLNGNRWEFSLCPWRGGGSRKRMDERESRVGLPWLLVIMLMLVVMKVTGYGLFRSRA